MRFRIVALRARIFYDLQSRDCAAGTRMPWHPVPRRAASAVLAGRCFDLQSADFFCLSDLRSAYQPAFGLYLMFYYKETALGLYRFFLFLQ